MRTDVAAGRVAYEPNSLAPDGPREHPTAGFRTFASADDSSDKLRVRAESFADHYSQARLFWRSMSEPEQRHIVNAFSFELGKVETVAIRRRMLGHLSIVDKILCIRVEQALGMEGQAERIQPARPPVDMELSPALSLVLKAPRTLEGRAVAALVSNGSDRALVEALRAAVRKAGARFAVVAPKIGGVAAKGGKRIDADHALAAAPSIFFDAVIVAPSEEGADLLAAEAAAVDWVRDAFGHLKVIGTAATAAALLQRAGVAPDGGVVAVDEARGVAAFINAAKGPRIWDREPALRSPA
jgi:catalase